MTDVTVIEGPLKGEQLEQAVGVSVRAFGDDPFFKFLFPNDARRDRSTGILHRVVLRQLSPISRVRTAFLDGKVVGLALWVPPGRWPFPPLLQVRQTFGTIPAFVGSFRSIATAGAVLRDVAKSHPKIPHWYLQLLMVDPPHQRQGLGAMLQAPVLEVCDREGLPAWVETQKPENLAYYGRFGFEVVQEHKATPEVSIWSLRREARAA